MLKIYRFSDSIINAPIVLALGHFDSVHLAHRELLLKCKNCAKELGASSAVFSFDNNPKEFFLKESPKLVYDFETRCDIFNTLNLDYILYETFNKSFSQLTDKQFLDKLKNFNIMAIVCGFDYTFGKNAMGNVEVLDKFCKKNNIKLHVLPKMVFDGKKISTSRIAKSLTSGDLTTANQLLGESYRYTETVCSGYSVGRSLGFSTANLPIKTNLTLLKDGVYAGYCLVEEKKFKAIINIGARMTFNDFEKKIEAHLLSFDGDLYGKKITLYFEKYLREQKRFASTEELSLQLKKDRAEAEALLK